MPSVYSETSSEKREFWNLTVRPLTHDEAVKDHVTRTLWKWIIFSYSHSWPYSSWKSVTAHIPMKRNENVGYYSGLEILTEIIFSAHPYGRANLKFQSSLLHHTNHPFLRLWVSKLYSSSVGYCGLQSTAMDNVSFLLIILYSTASEHRSIKKMSLTP